MRSAGLVTISIYIALSGASFHAKSTSLYDEATFRPMTADKRAFRVGDNLTVLIFENSSASTTADTSTRRRNDVNVQGNYGQRRNAAGLSLNNDFDGGGVVQRSGKLLGQITVNVVAVSPNGDLQVSGEQVLEINSDKQHIRLEGRVRPWDISEGNTVTSNRLADAKISYVGDGELAARQRPGWLSKLLVILGL